jgi:hypothetical protein
MMKLIQKRSQVYRLLFFLVLIQMFFIGVLHAEKDEMYTSSEEFLPLGSSLGEGSAAQDLSFLEDETLIHDAELAGIRLLKDENRLLFMLKAGQPEALAERNLKYDLVIENCPPRIVLLLYGVVSSETVYRFFKNLNVRGVVRNPFLNSHVSEYVIFLEDWAEVVVEYSMEEHVLSLHYSFAEPPYRRGYGVRIADTMIDPLPHIIEIKRELTDYGLPNFLLTASDEETVVLESPFFTSRQEAIAYIESLEGFGFKGKLAIREYRDFPKPHRFDVVSEVVITGEGDVNLENLVYSEFLPERIYSLAYSKLYVITKEIFSPRVQSDDELIVEYYYSLSEIYRNYKTESSQELQLARLVSIKLLEIIYFTYPKSQRADDALWEMANLINDHGIQDLLDEEECYRRILREYPGSIFREESRARLKDMES